MTKRVVVTGMGVISPVGNDLETFWYSIKNGKSGIGRLTRVDPDEFPSKIAGEVRNFDPTDYMDSRESRKVALFTQYAMAATHQALAMAGLKTLPAERTACIVGNGIGGFEIIEASFMSLFAKGAGAIHPMTIPKLITNECPGNIAIKYGITGPCFTVTTACASGTDAIGNALMHIRQGISDVVITGGTEASLTRMGVGGFCKLHTLSTAYNDQPEKASRPFDAARDGFVIGEGAGMMVLEELSFALKRGAPIIAELVGYAGTCDAYHPTAPDPEGTGGARAMQLALLDAGMQPEQIDYINAHGTSTPTNDPIETIAIKKAFGDHAARLKVSSTKSMTGHLIGGAGGVEAIVGLLAMRDGFFPPTINLDHPEEGCDLDFVPNTGVAGTINAFLSDSLGFGGHNGALIFKKYEV